MPLALPHTTLTASGDSRDGIPGCGWEFGTGGQITGGTSCSSSGLPVPPYAVDIPSTIEVTLGQKLSFSLPSGYHFQAWTYAYVDQAAAEFYRGAEPPGVHVASQDRSASATTVRVEAPPAGDWMVRFTFDATNGNNLIHGMPDYFRLVVR